MNKKIIVVGIILILIGIIFTVCLMFSYEISPKLININSMRLESNNLKLNVTNNNASGYIKKIKVVNKDNEVYVYFVGTPFKMFRMDKKSVHDININMENVTKVVLKGRSIETIVFQIKDI